MHRIPPTTQDCFQALTPISPQVAQIVTCAIRDTEESRASAGEPSCRSRHRSSASAAPRSALPRLRTRLAGNPNRAPQSDWVLLGPAARRADGHLARAPYPQGCGCRSSKTCARCSASARGDDACRSCAGLCARLDGRRRCSSFVRARDAAHERLHGTIPQRGGARPPRARHRVRG